MPKEIFPDNSQKSAMPNHNITKVIYTNELVKALLFMIIIMVNEIRVNTFKTNKLQLSFNFKKTL